MTSFFSLCTVTYTDHWSCRSVYRRQDVCVAKVILWILSSCTYWWENIYPPHTWLMPPPIVAWWPPHTWLMTPPHTWLMAPPILGWWPPHTWLMAPPYLAHGPPIVGWWPPPTHTCMMPPPHGWMICWFKLVLVLYVWRQDRLTPAQQGLPFIDHVWKNLRHSTHNTRNTNSSFAHPKLYLGSFCVLPLGFWNNYVCI